ncbi:serine hydrolase domain-containing protein [Nesterenkonia sp. CL21]|uniref:serine hydrolase domain-containing protein n=1 Tax=Nesterenkonia sp. CL21 TaxID=3064894 RepID=UPI002879919B|nr:serine hydrolase domain-containing protein [Nesterenkonia sp. CL21]MDS2174295.1 serine hydrolase domain-containing protein [Nesterenkonia sp. CL21]
MTNSLHELLTRHVEDGTMPGVVGTDGEEFAPISIGLDAPDGAPLEIDTIFRIQSMTKTVVAAATLRLVQDGVMTLDDPIGAWLPELAEPRVLAHPDAPLEETQPARRPITVRHLLTHQSGYGVMTADTPLRQAMIDRGVEAGAEPVALGAQDWLDALASLPLAFQPGDGWRYHHDFGLLGILLGRLGRGSTEDVLAETVFTPAGMVDTGFTVPSEQAHRLPAVFQRTAEGFEACEPAGAGFYVAPAPFDVSHSELVSTVGDYHAFLSALRDGRLIDSDLRDEMCRDQVDQAAKTLDSFYPGFWEGMGWGYGVSVVTDGPDRGRFSWSGGLGTDFFVDPDGRICLAMMQVAMDERVFALLAELRGLGRA